MKIQGEMIFMDWLSEGYDDGQNETYLEFGYDPFAELFQFLSGNKISLSYYICDKKCTLEEAQIDFIKQLDGEVDCEYASKYSEVTGALGIDEDFVIGGHNLLKELWSYVSKKDRPWIKGEKQRKWLILRVSANGNCV